MIEEVNFIVVFNSDKNTIWVPILRTEWEYFISNISTQCIISNQQLLIPMKEYIAQKYYIDIDDIEAEDNGSIIIKVSQLSRETITYLEEMLGLKLSYISTERVIDYNNIGLESTERTVISLKFTP